MAQIDDFWSPAVLRARVDAFIENGGKEKLAAIRHRHKTVTRGQIYKSLTPDRDLLNQPVDF